MEREAVEAVMRRRDTVEDRWALHSLAVLRARVARTGCRFGCLERAGGPSPYCPEHQAGAGGGDGSRR